MSVKTIDKEFARNIKNGLLSTPKTISSKYFYDEIGDQLFQAIMHMNEYYLTNSEYEIFSMQKDALLSSFQSDKAPFNLIEFGAGDGYKTKLLLEYFLSQNVPFKYTPIDISSNALNQLEKDLKKNLPALHAAGIQGEYFSALKELNEDSESTRKVILFLGSNIGNFNEEEAIAFLSSIHANISKNDTVLIGFDLKKDPNIILEAYNDKAGITKAFNLNVLKRINHELGADFDENQFDHFPIYDPLTGTTKSYLVSKTDQNVKIDALDLEISFKQWEAIHTEISQKYDLEMINDLAQKSGFKVVHQFFDCKHYYVNSLWEKI